MRASPAHADPRRLRIVLAPSAYYPHVGGIEELTRQLALKLAARGHVTSVLTNRWPEGTPPQELLGGVDVTRLRFPLPALTIAGAAGFAGTAGTAAAALVSWLRRARADVVHVHGAGPQSVYMAALRPLIHARVVFTSHGERAFDANGIFERSTSLRLGLRMMLARADAVTACSAYVLHDLESVGKIASPTSVVPNGIDLLEFEPRASRERAEPPYVLAVGRLVPQKGLDVLLAAAADVRLAGMRVVVAGDGPQRSELERQAKRLRISDRVTFAGDVGRARIAELFHGASAFAFPSRGEGFGIALLEAMAAGVPAVAASAGGIPEFAQDGENALLVPVDDASALTGALARVLSDDALAARLVEGGIRTATVLSWERIAERYERLYAAALAR